MSDSPFPSKDDKTPLKIDKEELDRFNQEMIKSDLIAPDRLYADLALFKDYNIGVLASIHAQNKPHVAPEIHKANFQSLIDALPDYQERMYDDMAHYFPKFVTSQEQFEARLADPQFTSHILHHSPVTPYIAVMVAQIAVIENHSLVAGKRNPITMVLNTYPLQLPKNDQFIVATYFARLLSINVEVVYNTPAKMTYTYLHSFDEIYTLYYREMFESETIREGFAALKFLHKRLFAVRVFGNKIPPGVNVERERLIIQNHLGILTDFKFVHPRLCSCPPPNVFDEPVAEAPVSNTLNMKGT